MEISSCFTGGCSGVWNVNQVQIKCSRHLILFSSCIPWDPRDSLEWQPLLPIHHHFLKGTKVSPSEYTPKTEIARILRHSNLQINMYWHFPESLHLISVHQQWGVLALCTSGCICGCLGRTACSCKKRQDTLNWQNESQPCSEPCVACRAVAATHTLPLMREVSQPGGADGVQKDTRAVQLNPHQVCLVSKQHNQGSRRPFFNPSRHSSKYFYKWSLERKRTAVRNKTNENMTPAYDSICKVMSHSMLLLNISYLFWWSCWFYSLAVVTVKSFFMISSFALNNLTKNILLECNSSQKLAQFESSISSIFYKMGIFLITAIGLLGTLF